MVEYEAGKFRIDKDATFLFADPYDGTDGRLYAIGGLALDLYDTINKRHNVDAYRNGSRYAPVMISEMMTNAEMHGNKFSPERHTWISYRFTENNDQSAELEITVRDEGSGFDYNHVKAASEQARGSNRTYNYYRQEATERPEGGNGLFGMLDRCSAATWNDTGNEMTAALLLKK